MLKIITITCNSTILHESTVPSNIRRPSYSHIEKQTTDFIVHVYYIHMNSIFYCKQMYVD